MDKIKKDPRLVAIAAFGFLYLVFWYMARSVLDAGREITEDNREEEVEEVKDIDVTLNISGRSIQQSFRQHLTTNETIGDLLESLHNSGTLSYEYLEYTYGTEITDINGVEASSNYYKWNVYSGDSKVADFTRHKLTDDGIYTIRLELVTE